MNSAEDSNMQDTTDENAPTGGNVSRKPIYAFIAAIVVIIGLVVGGVALNNRGDDNGSSQLANSSNGSSVAVVDGQGENGAEGDEPFVDAVPYVDSSGSQEQEIQPAPGEFNGISGMSISINGKEASVDPIQLTDTGTLIPPVDVSKVGWYSASAVPGDEGNTGSSVITGHINYSNQGTGYADNFVHLKEGDEFTIKVNGEDRKFRISTAPYRLPKGSEFPSVVNDTTGENKVVMITCGGEFVGGSLGYADNIITVAERAD